MSVFTATQARQQLFELTRTPESFEQQHSHQTLLAPA